ncbi:MAG: ATP-binding protein [Anaerovoracaceae bacterium]
MLFNKIQHLLILAVLICFVFICCLANYISVSNKIMVYEKEATGLLIFNNSYEYSFNQIISETLDYIQNGSVSSQYKVTSHIKNFMSCTSINLKNIEASSTVDPDFFNQLSVIGDFYPEPVPSFSLNEQEKETFKAYLETYNQLAERLLQAASTNDFSIIFGTEFTSLRMKKSEYSSACAVHYVQRMNENISMLNSRLTTLLNVCVFTGVCMLILLAQISYIYFKRSRKAIYFNQLYSKALDNANVGLAILDTENTYEYINSKYAELLRIQTDEALGREAYSILPDEMCEMLPSTKDVQKIDNLLLSYTHEGETYYINCSRFPIYDNNDKKKVVSIIQDYTESRKKDAELQKRLKEVQFFSEAKSTFAANISHEMKTPLNVINGMLHILKGTPLNTKQREILEKIDDSSELLVNLINDVLDIAQLHKSEFTLYPCEFDLTEMIEEVEQNYMPAIAGHKLEFFNELNFTPHLHIKADKARLSQALLNILDNAFKFTASGYIKVSAEEIERSSQSVLLRFSVEDTGPGIEKKDIPRLFEEFEQIEDHLTKEHSGTGLGLPICKHIVNAMGGDIWVESKKGMGSRFVFTIWAELAPSVSIKTETAEVLTQLPANTCRVLVVEDIELNYEVTKSMLEEAGISCDHAWDGQEAVDMCVRVPEDYYAVILMDIHMPNMDGYTAAEILKTEIGTTSPIIALTATNFDEEIRDKYEGIIDDFLAKPFKYDDFYNAISPYLNFSLLKASESTESESVYTAEIRAGAANLGCSEKQYLKHYTKFKTNYAKTDTELERLLAAGNIEEAHRLIHSVKGLAGTLSLFNLQKASKELEVFLKDIMTNSSKLSCLPQYTASEAFKKLMDNFRTELKKICS